MCRPAVSAASAAVASAAVASAAVALLLLLVPRGMSGQVRPTGQLEDLANRFRADFAIPDAPAFTILEVEPTEILRPATVRALAIGLSGLANEGGSIGIPRALAVEFSPGLLIGGARLSLADYQRNVALYRLRVSAVTRRRSGEGSATDLAVGVRASLLDGADLRTSTAYLSDAQSVADSIQRIREAVRERLGPRAPIVLSPEETAAVDRLLTAFRKRWESRLWNRPALDVAFALRAGSSDSLGRDARVDQVAGWGSYGLGFGEWGELLVGAKVASSRDSLTGEFGARVALAGRMYAGTNQYRVFVEGQFEARPRQDAWTVQGGAEAQLTGGIWTTALAGLEFGPSRPADVRANLAVKLGVLGL